MIELKKEVDDRKYDMKVPLFISAVKCFGSVSASFVGPRDFSLGDGMVHCVCSLTRDGSGWFGMTTQ